jgi:hypothetical protein
MRCNLAAFKRGKMLYIEIKNGKAVKSQTEYPGSEAMRARRFENRNDWKSFKRAEQVAAELNEIHGKPIYLATDSGPHVSPRYDVIVIPQVGDEVSYSFNGDTYPDGKITFVSDASKNFRIIKTDTGSVYYRRKLAGGWLKVGGTWSLVRGHINERNPSF